MEESSIVVDIFVRIVIPILTLVGGWFFGVFRTKQKKQKDILDNVTQILDMQKNYIADQDEERKKDREDRKRLEALLDAKNKSIRAANWCEHTNKGGGCPVLVEENKADIDRCSTCKLHNPEDNAHSED